MQNNTNSSSKAKEFIKKHKKPLIITGGTYLLLMFGVMVWAISFAFSDTNDSSYVVSTNSSSQTEAPVGSTENTAPQGQASESKSRHTVSESAAEYYCQDAGLLNKYINSSKISTIYVSNYGKKYTNSFSYDKNGNPIWFFQWNGKNKSTGEAAEEVGNVVDASNKKLSPDLFLEAIGKMSISFDKDGKPNLPTMIISQKMGDEWRRVAAEANADPEHNAKFKALMKQKKEEYDAEQASRKLVD